MSRKIAAAAIAAVVGLAVGVGLGALLFSSSSTTSTTTTTVDPKPVSLPASLAGFRDITDVIAARSPQSAAVQRQLAHQAAVSAATDAAYRKAFGGAGVAYRQYSDSRLEKLPYVIAVRAPTPALTLGPVISASYLGLATPEREVRTVGAVSCQILWSPPTVAGHTPPSSSEHIVGCQRSTGGLTVFTGGGSFAGPADLQEIVDLTNAAWSAASSS
ncbi:MAG TPA: hypothetical protein VMU39_20435 [Solirubrobacteraceae bacterium]|nr:hypothetical protein [Solirubrobacteraceae bacterium]